VQRGKILDRNNTIITETLGESGSLQRVLHYPTLSAVVGYSNANYGQGGLEASLDSILRGVEGNDPAKVLSTRLLSAQYPAGADIRLSLDVNLQLIADDLLKGQTGSIIMLNAESGEVMVMATSPTFDANQLEENWESWKTNPSSPLLNRATQGQYPAGNATGGLILARMLTTKTLPSIAPENEWSTDIQKTLYCAKNPGSEPSWENLIISGCNRSFNMLKYYLGSTNLTKLYQQFGLYTQPNLAIAEPTPAADLNVADTAADDVNGLLVSPLQLAAAYGALSNGGHSITPTLAMAFSYGDDHWNLFSSDSAPAALPDLDTAQSAALLTSSTLPGWSLTSTSLTETGKINWFIAGTPSDWKGTPLVMV
ncbi:hypothetical protein EG834_18235, partial [bacterium]|nr:hypothetical protein [bacterium]